MTDLQDLLEKLRDERNDLNDKIVKLSSYIDRRHKSSKEDLEPLYTPMRILEAQLDAMCRYLAILDERIIVAKTGQTF